MSATAILVLTASCDRDHGRSARREGFPCRLRAGTTDAPCQHSFPRALRLSTPGEQRVRSIGGVKGREYVINQLGRETIEDPTWEAFECVVTGSEALAWLEKNRPGHGSA